MQEFTLVKDYLGNDRLRGSLSALAKKTFHIDIEHWWQNDLTFQKYIPWSLCAGDRIVANISANLFTLMIGGETKKAVQLGTVMTDEEYRGHGLSARLMEAVLGHYEQKTDLIYLFANDSVLQFYPKFGFRRYAETRFELDASTVARAPSPLRGLDPEQEDDRGIIMRMVQGRVPASRQFGVLNDPWPLLAYCLDDRFRLPLHYLPELDCIVLFEQNGGTLELFDILSLKPFCLDEILARIVEPDDRVANIRFVPDTQAYAFQKTPVWEDNDALFIRGNFTPPACGILFPPTSHT